MLFVSVAIFVHIRFIKVESLQIRYRNSIVVDTSATSEAEGDPVLLLNSAGVEWKVYFVYWADVARREDLESC